MCGGHVCFLSSCPGFAQEESDDRGDGGAGGQEAGGRSLSAVLAPGTEGLGGARKWALQGELWRALGCSL